MKSRLLLPLFDLYNLVWLKQHGPGVPPFSHRRVTQGVGFIGKTCGHFSWSSPKSTWMINWLVVSTPLKNMKVSWDDHSQYMEKKTCSKPPISQPWMINLKTSSITLDAKLNSTPSPTMRPCFLQRTGIRPTGGWKIYTPSPVPSHTNLRGLYECTLEIFLALDSSQSLWKPGSIG